MIRITNYRRLPDINFKQSNTQNVVSVITVFIADICIKIVYLARSY